MEEYERSGRPKKATSYENFELVPSRIMCNKIRSLPDIARQTGIGFGVVQSVLAGSLGMSKNSARYVPRMLTKDNKKSRLDLSIASLYMKMTIRNLCVVTQDETWVHHFDPEAKKQIMQWKYPGACTLLKKESFFSREDLLGQSEFFNDGLS